MAIQSLIRGFWESLNVRKHYWLLLTLSFLLYVAIGLVLSSQSLFHYWNWDDLHLIRVFSGKELASVFSGTWDVDHIESAGFRPFTTLFNHARAVLFGESTFSHRLFLLLLYSVYLVLFGVLIHRFDIPWTATVLTGILILCAKNSFYHFLWITDGVHILQGILFVISALLLLFALDHHSLYTFSASLLLAGLCLLVREDSVAIYPILVFLGTSYALRKKKLSEVFKYIIGYSLVLCMIFILFWYFRALFVPQAEGFRLGIDPLYRFYKAALLTICLAGEGRTSKFFFIFFGAILGIVFVGIKRDDQYKCLMWLGCMVIACSPALVTLRTNLLFFSISFYAAFLGTFIVIFARTSHSALIFVIAFWLFAVGTSARMSYIQQQSMNPMSVDQLWRDWSAIYGPESNATIPAQRVQNLKAKLTQLGIGPEYAGTPDDPKKEWRRLNDNLRQQGRYGFFTDNKPFIPRKCFLCR